MKGKTAAVERHSASEGVQLLGRLRELSENALEAVRAMDPDALLRVLEERSRLISRADDVLYGLQLDTSSPAAGPLTKYSTLLAAARDLQKSDERLSGAIAAQRDAFAHDLSELENRGAARSAYGHTRRGTENINIVR